MTHSPSSAQSGLLPCPFCGPGESVVDLWHDDVAHRWRVGCGRCGCSTGIHPRDKSQEPAITAWNRRAAASAHTIGEDAANVAMGEREAPLSLIPDLVKRDELAVNTALLEIGDAMSMWRAAVCKYREITSHDQSAFCDGYEAGMAEILKARTQTGQEPVAWALKGKSGVVREVTADREATSNWHPDFVVALSENSTLYAAPQQPAQLVAQTLALTDEQRKSIWWAVLEAEKDEPEPGTLMHRRAQDLRALLAAQPASGETE